MPRVAMLIGNAEFLPNSGFKPLRFPVNDVKELECVLVDTQIGRFDTVVTVVNKTKHEIIQRCSELLKSAAGGEFLFYFSGHGMPNAISRKLAFATLDTNDDHPYATMVQFSDIINMKEEFGVKTFVAILDCCYAGLGGDDIRSSKQAELDAIVKDTVKSCRGVFFLGAANGFEVAREDENLSHGVLTSAILEGLRTGNADKDSNGYVTATDLYLWCNEHVARHGRQTVVTKHQEQGGNIIVAYTQRQKSPNLIDDLAAAVIASAQKSELFPQALMDALMNAHSERDGATATEGKQTARYSLNTGYDTLARFRPKQSHSSKNINLALQGGGHSAYTWGVLDAILEDTRLEIEAVSAVGSGSMNAVVMAAGLVEGRDGARKKLADFWQRVAKDASQSEMPVVDIFTTMWKEILNSPKLVKAETDATSPYESNPLNIDPFATSPYEFNPLNISPLRDLLERIVDFAMLREQLGPSLFIGTTNVFTGTPVIFRRNTLTVERVMASACSPHLFQAPEIDGVPHWEGAYSGNPPLRPLFNETHCQDHVLVQTTPIVRRRTPRTSDEIRNRTNEIAFNGGLLAELRELDLVSRLLAGILKKERQELLRLHRIGGDGRLERLSVDTKYDVSWQFLQRLRDLGRESAKEWLSTSFDKIGTVSTMDIGSEARTPLAL